MPIILPFSLSTSVGGWSLLWCNLSCECPPRWVRRLLRLVDVCLKHWHGQCQKLRQTASRFGQGDQLTQVLSRVPPGTAKSLSPGCVKSTETSSLRGTTTIPPDFEVFVRWTASGDVKLDRMFWFFYFYHVSYSSWLSARCGKHVVLTSSKPLTFQWHPNPKI